MPRPCWSELQLGRISLIYSFLPLFGTGDQSGRLLLPYTVTCPLPPLPLPIDSPIFRLTFFSSPQSSQPLVCLPFFATSPGLLHLHVPLPLYFPPVLLLFFSYLIYSSLSRTHPFSHPLCAFIFSAFSPASFPISPPLFSISPSSQMSP